MTLVIEQLRQWQAQDGPHQWQAAWQRAVELLSPLWPEVTMVGEGPVLADGGAALATAFYLLASEQGIAPAEVSRPQVRALIDRAPGQTDSALLGRWEERLRALGHDLDDAGDPVTVRWQQLRTDNSPPEDASDSLHVEHGSEYRCGPGALEGLRHVLAPIYEEHLRF